MAQQRFIIPKEQRQGAINDPSITGEVSLAIKVAFEKEVIDYAKFMERTLTEGTSFNGINLGMPMRNLNDIKVAYIKTAADDLKARGFKRYQSVARATIEDLLDHVMDDISNGRR
jgi:hypothetical protein